MGSRPHCGRTVAAASTSEPGSNNAVQGALGDRSDSLLSVGLMPYVYTMWQLRMCAAHHLYMWLGNMVMASVGLVAEYGKSSCLCSMCTRHPQLLLRSFSVISYRCCAKPFEHAACYCSGGATYIYSAAAAFIACH